MGLRYDVQEGGTRDDAGLGEERVVVSWGKALGCQGRGRSD